MLPYVYLFVLAAYGVSAQKTEGDWCTLKNGDTGVCTLISQCTPAVMLGRLGMRPAICSFQGRTPIVCCGESLNTQLYYATSSTTTRPHRKSSSENSRAPNNQRYSNENTRPTSHNDNNQQYPAENSRPSSNNYNQRYPTENNRPSSNNNNNNQRYPTENNRPSSNNNNNQQYPAENSRPSSNNYNQRYPTENNRPSSNNNNNNQRYPTENNRPTSNNNNNQIYPTENNRPTSNNNNNQRYPTENNRPSSNNNNNQRYPTENNRPTSNNNNNQRYPTENSRPSPNNNIQYPNGNTRPSSNNNRYPNDNSRPLVESSSGNRPFRPGSGSEKPTVLFPVRPDTDRESESPTRQPPAPSSNKRRLSEIKCGEYSRLVTDVVEAIPLIPNAQSVALEVQKCDLASLQLIVGGNKTEPGEFPHMAAIGFQNDRGGLEWKCGGSLISDLYVLTAGHCTYTGLGPPVVVRLGEYNLRSSYDGAHPVDYRVAKIIRHPDYKPPARYNDIALLMLHKPVQFSKYIRPACLYTQPRIDHKKAVATGWGNIDYAESPSDILLKVPLSIVDNNLCNDLYQSDSRSNHLSRGIISSMLCAGELSGGKDTCQGDSGGPLQVTRRNNQCVYYIIGVTSFGKYCAAKNAPGVYTRVSHFVPWIESVVWS